LNKDKRVTNRVKISPSILAADFSCLYQEISRVEREVDSLHFDIMDGHFVPNITFGPGLVASLRKKVNLLFEIHLMVDNPQEWINPFTDAGADLITVHVETSLHLDRLVTIIKEKGPKVGVALNPATSLQELEYVISEVDVVLAMTVNPGFGSQSLLSSVIPKIRDLREIIKKRRLSLGIEVDGGINQDTAARVIEAGASILVAGTAVFNASDPEKAILRLKNSQKGELGGNKNSTAKNGS